MLPKAECDTLTLGEIFVSRFVSITRATDPNITYNLDSRVVEDCNIALYYDYSESITIVLRMETYL